MPEIRERKKNDKIKGKGGRGHPIKQGVPRQMTAKLQKELMERQRGRDTGSTTEQAPEVQAAEQVEQRIYTTADSLREHTSDAVSKSAARYQRKQQKKKRRADPATGETSPADAEAPQAPARERVREKPVGDTRTRPAGDSAAAPVQDVIQSGPCAPRRDPGRTPAGPSAKERMRQTAIRKKQDRPTDIRQKPADPQRLPQASPPGPRERMRQKAIADIQAQRGSPRAQAVWRPERPPAPKGVFESKPLSTGNQSINPIKERPRRSFAPKEKPAGGAFIPKTRQAAAVSKSTGKAASVAAKKKAAARPLEQAKRRVQRNAQRKLLQQSKAAARAALKLSRKAAVVIAKAVSSLISALAGLLGGAVLIPVFCLIILVAAIAASPFGILFSNEPTPDAVPLNVAVGQLNMELSDTLETLQTGDYDSIDIQGQGPDWREVVAVFAAKTAGADDGIDVAALTPDRVERLKAVFWNMCAVSSEVESIDHPATDTAEAWTETILHITITAKTAEDMRTEYAFSEYQNQALTELLAELATMELLLTDLSVSQEQARELLQSLPADLSPERRAVVETACRLVGKVNYFWGGKSLAIGWDSRWGTLQKVWAEGSSTTGTYRPYGLDCSGFVDWVLRNAGLPSNGHWYINRNLTAVSQADALPGDLALYPDASHLGIVVGRNEAGKLLVCHCSSGQNNVVITEFTASGFTVVGRLAFMGS